MSDKFKELLAYALTAWYECPDNQQSKKFETIANSLMSIGYDDGFIDDVSEIVQTTSVQHDAL